MILVYLGFFLRC
jgi:hypothetical protein